MREHHKTLLGRERGSVVKDPGGRLKVVVLYPNTYQVGMANLGLAVIYRLLNDRPDTLCERAFLPGRQAQAIYAKTGDVLASLESSRPVADFDLVLATLSFENDAPNLAAMLMHAGLGFYSESRRGPLVVAGGVAAMLNPEPYAPLMDGLLLGEAEVVLGPFMETLLEQKELSREERLLELAQKVPGFYAPRFYRPSYHDDGTLAAFTPSAEVPARIVAPKYQGPAAGLARSALTAAPQGKGQGRGPEFGDMALLEVGRGCGHACRFCAAGHVNRPPRLGEGRDFAAAALQAAQQVGKVGLVSAAVSDLAGGAELARTVVEAGGRISVSSLRADCLSLELVRALAESGSQSVALAPEAGSERLRRVINKHLSEAQLVRAVEALITGGILNLKLYFMVGLPTETEADVAEMIDLVKLLRQQVVSFAKEQGRLGQVAVSLNAFVPKPWTPFQWEPMAPLKLIKDRMAQIKTRLGRLANLKVTSDVPKYARLQAALSRGDRRLAPLIATLARDPQPQRAEAALGLDLDFFATRRRHRDELLPWDLVDHGIGKEYLWDEAQRALKGKESPPCQVGVCHRCGVCA
ncbi:hypothetical protein AAU61_07940 [Desulfocarbo indianensis]|nr:hypothetical protein AAU61_07940 [Desulfocarbo indianensis]